MAMLKAITTTFGWLAGSLAAISALLGGCGFIIVRSHSNLLGLGDFLQYSNDQYIIEGSQFLLYTIILANGTVLRIGALALLTAGIPLYFLAKSRWSASTRTRWKERLESFRDKHGWLFPLVTGIVLFTLFFFRLVPYLEDFQGPMAISDLLIATTAKKAPNMCDEERRNSSGCIKDIIVQGDSAALRGYYFSLMLHYMEAALILFILWRISATWPHKTMVRLPFSAILLAFTLLMPMCYGVLVKPVELSPLILKMRNAPDAMLSGDLLFILQKSDDAFLAWNHTRRKIVWYPVNNIDSVVIGHRQPLFSSPTAAKEGSP